MNEGDLLVTALSLGFSTTALREQPGCAPTVLDKVLPQALALVKSPLLQGASSDRDSEVGRSGMKHGHRRWRRQAGAVRQAHSAPPLPVCVPAGAALEALQSFFQALVSSGAKATSAQSLLEQLRAAGTGAGGPWPGHSAWCAGSCRFLLIRFPPGCSAVPCADAETSKSAQHAAAQCYAVLSAAAGQSDVNATVERLLGMLQVGGLGAQ